MLTVYSYVVWSQKCKTDEPNKKLTYCSNGTLYSVPRVFTNEKEKQAGAEQCQAQEKLC